MELIVAIEESFGNFSYSQSVWQSVVFRAEEPRQQPPANHSKNPNGTLGKNGILGVMYSVS